MIFNDFHSHTINIRIKLYRKPAAAARKRPNMTLAPIKLNEMEIIFHPFNILKIYENFSYEKEHYFHRKKIEMLIHIKLEYGDGK